MIEVSIALAVVGVAACYVVQRVALAWIAMRGAERLDAEQVEKLRADVARLREEWRDLATGARSRVRA